MQPPDEAPEGAGTAQEPKQPVPSWDPVVVEFQCPVPMGSETITKLTLKPSAKAFRDFEMPMTADGTLLYRPYQLALVGAKMAGQTSALVDRMHPADMNEVAQVVLGFTGSGRGTGRAPSR